MQKTLRKTNPSMDCGSNATALTGHIRSHRTLSIPYFPYFPSLSFLILLLLPFIAIAEPLLKAFPTAEGFGACTPGGRGGKVIFVTTLDDYDPAKDKPIEGSLRAAVDAVGPRCVVFRVTGTIALKTDLLIVKPYITISGQSAPGGGICIRDYQVVLGTNDVILRHLRIRSGDVTRKEQMALGIFGGNNSIVDHCSMSWAIDEVMSSFGTVHNLTVQWSTIAEGLSKSFHPKGEHSKGSILHGDGGVTIHHSVYAHNSARNPRIDSMLLDFRNNVVYNWGYRCGYTSGGPIFTNYVNNYFKPGPSTRKNAVPRVFNPGDDMPRMYLAGNILHGRELETADNALFLSASTGFDETALRATVVATESFPAPDVATDSATEALQRILDDAGATKPKRDSVDTRLMDEIRNGTGAIIDSQQQVGAWPTLDPGTPAPDSDNDGMPDAWETRHSLDPKKTAGAGSDVDNDGYTDVEEFLNDTDPRTPEVGHTVDRETFVAVQNRAVEIVAAGDRDEAARTGNAQAQRSDDIARIKQTLRIAFDAQPGVCVQRTTLDLGGAATLALVRIPAGSFLMGSPESEGGLENERPQHKVNISRAFYIAAAPTTTAQYCAVFGPNARELTDATRDLPAKETNWFEANEFCDVLSAITGQKFRLPTEAEWEYACRAGTTTAFNTGTTITTDQANFNGLEATPFNPAGLYRAKLTPVQMFPPNPWGLHDTHGNQAEYCQDICFRQYTTEEMTDPIGAGDKGARVLRGGKMGSKAFYVRSAYRYGYAPLVGYGFRVVMESE